MQARDIKQHRTWPQTNSRWPWPKWYNFPEHSGCQQQQIVTEVFFSTVRGHARRYLPRPTPSQMECQPTGFVCALFSKCLSSIEDASCEPFFKSLLSNQDQNRTADLPESDRCSNHNATSLVAHQVWLHKLFTNSAIFKQNGFCFPQFAMNMFYM